MNEYPSYDPKKIEKKWQDAWAEQKLYKTANPLSSGADSAAKKKFYILDMFPYPSGEGLHVGHPKGYIATDVISRMKRMQGFNVLHPMGFDAFGLPAENYAIKMKTNPKVAVEKNVAHYKEQLEKIGFDYDWSREVNTTDPGYYRWTQWIFAKLFEKGLAFESFEPINWCPTDKTGLANEDIENGRCERCGTLVEKKKLRQWVLRITDYADRLLKDLDAVDAEGKPLLDWPESIKEAQRNWIGRSEGVNFHCTIKDLDIKVDMYNSVPQTYRAETFTVIAPEHALVSELVRGLPQEKEVLDFVEYIKQKKAANKFDAEKEMEGIFTGRYIENYAGTGRDLPIWIASYALVDYGTGMVNCSAHDIRDYAFAKKYNIPLHPVAEPFFKVTDGPDAVKDDIPFVERDAAVCVVKHWSEDKYLCLSWKSVDWKGFVVGGIEKGEDAVTAGIREIIEETGFKNPVFVQELGGTVHAQFYQSIKKVNRFAHFKPLLFTLKNGDQNELAEDEKALHDLVWISKEEVASFINRNDMLAIWDRVLGIEKPIVKNGILVEPEEFKGREWSDVRKDIIDYLVTKKFASRKVNYRIKDWVFSRQRYWGEPIPVVHSVDEAMRRYKKDAKVSLNFYVQDVWDDLVSGSKSLETRALNPDETDRYFGNVRSNDFILCTNKNTNEEALYRVKSVKLYTSLEELFADTAAIEKLGGKKAVSIDIDDLKKNYARFGEGYLEKIAKNGLIAWEIERATAPILVPETDLPVTLPNVSSYEPTGTGESPLAAIHDWVNVSMEYTGSDGKKYTENVRRETNTMPQWAGSSWYYLRYMDPQNNQALVDKKIENYWNEVDFYVGGAEHATRHLIYARFWHKFLYDIGVVTTSEPFKKLQSVGLIMAEDGRKMSKRYGNVVNPDEIIELYGADTLRLYEMFMGPFDQAISWSTTNMIGSRRFLEKIWRMADRLEKGLTDQKPRDYEQLLHKTIQKVTDDIIAMRFNTAISSMMILTNEMEKSEKIFEEDFDKVLKILAPFAPHMAEEIWNTLGKEGSVHRAEWPKADPKKLVSDKVKIFVQINGKVRTFFKTDVNTSEENVKNTALNMSEVKKWTDTKTVEKVIYVPNKLINIVVK